MADRVRKAVCDGLLQVTLHGGYSNLVLRQLLKREALAGKEAAFASALLYGSLERLLTLDKIIDAYARPGIARLSPQVVAVLRVSLYQLLYLESVPDYSAVHEGVELVRAYGQPQAAGLINGVLRSVIRSRGNLFPKGFATREEYLEYRFSCPYWIIDMLTQRYGEEEAKVILANSLGAPPLFVRVNPLKTDTQTLAGRFREKNIAVLVHTSLPNCICLMDAGNIYDSEEFKEGLFHVQDLSSQICSLAVEARPGDTVLDLCAAPGGKSFTMAQEMENQGALYSLDLYPAKVGLIREGAERLGLTAVRPGQNDALEENPSLPLADRVLCDAPCSGFGIIRRKPEIKYKTREQIASLPALQAKILDSASRYVKQGGRLVYSTCTLNPAENEEQAAAFLARHPDFAPAPLPDTIAPYKKSPEDTALTLLTNEHSDGFFLQAFTRL